MAFKMKEMGSQEKNFLHMAFFSNSLLYIVCMRQRMQTKMCPITHAVCARFFGSYRTFAVEMGVALGYNAGAWLR
jgi:hypothetical protein